MKNSYFLYLAFFSFLSTISGQEISFTTRIGDLKISGQTNAIIQDKLGFIWLGTDYGLHRIDGRQITSFKYNQDNTQGLPHAKVNSLLETNNGDLLIGTQNGLCIFDPKKEKFQQIMLDKKAKIINDIMEDDQGNFWIATSYGLFHLDQDHQILKRLVSVKGVSPAFSGNAVWAVKEDSYNRIWAGTNRGFTVVSNDGEYETRVVIGDLKKEDGFQADRVFSIVELPDKSVWLGTYDGIFETILNDTFEFKHIYKGEGADGSFYNHIFFNMIMAKDGSVWAGTYRGGLNHFVKKDSIFSHKLYRSDSGRRGSITINEITALLIDRTNQVWVGHKLGVDVGSNYSEKFEVLQSSRFENSLSNNYIKSIHIDSHENLWVGTYDGLNYLSSEYMSEEQFDFTRINYKRGLTDGLRNDHINGINEDKEGRLWVSCMFGLHFFKIEEYLDNLKINCFTHHNGIPHTMNFYSQEVSPNKYLVAGYDNMSLLDLNNQDYEKSSWNVFRRSSSVNTLNSYYFTDICPVTESNTLLGSIDGVELMIESNDSISFKSFRKEGRKDLSMSDNSFNCFFKTSKQNVLVGTDYGLNKFIINASGEVEKIVKFQGEFEDVVVNSIQEDDNGRFWLGTMNGLHEVDILVNNSINLIRSYNIDDGLPSNAFTERASEKDKNGNLYFGTDNGLVRVDPIPVSKNSHAPLIQFTSLKINDVKQGPNNSKNTLLTQSMPYSNVIELGYDYKTIELKFAAMDYTNPSQNKYKYRLSSIGEEWFDLGHNTTIVFNNLNIGWHRLELLGSNNDGIWSQDSRNLDIYIKPPFWKSNLAYFLYSFILLGIGFYIIRSKVRKQMQRVVIEGRIEKARIEARENLRKKNAEDFHDDLGHRLSKISLFLELAERSTDKESKTFKYLRRVKEHTSNLSGGIRDLIWSLDPLKDSLSQTLLRLQEFGDQLFEFSNIDFKTDIKIASFDQLYLNSEKRKHILLIFKEAMNNALKYSDAKNLILKCQHKKDEILIELIDDGKGFDLFKSSKGYGLNNMKSRAKKISADFKIKTAPDEGVMINLILKQAL